MKNICKILAILGFIFCLHSSLLAHTTEHHMIDTGKNLVKCALYPLHGIFIQGPKNVKKAWQYEVHGLEKPEKRGRLPARLSALWRAPGEEAKGIIDGLVDSVKAGGRSVKEFISIFFGD